jgi:cytochrome c556
MRKLAAVAIALTLATLALVAPGKTDNPVATDTGTPLTLPPSLDNLYPPNAPAPVYLLNMIELTTSFSGIVSDLLENDLENSRKNYDKFRDKYTEIAASVPEWKDLTPMAPVEELGTAMKSGDPGQIMASVEKAGELCNGCHMKNMPLVQQKYHWGDFDVISVTDPLSGQEVSFGQLMLMMDANMAGVGLDVEQGQRENAMMQAQGLEARFGALKEACSGCHDSEREYYVGNATLDMLDRMKLALDVESPDPQTIGGILNGIGEEGCFKCHLVHIPAAYARYQMRGKSPTPRDEAI